jgi:RimJ/RimL family protein N-acetyltransferase
MTLRYVYGYDTLVAQFVAEMIPHCRRGFGPCAAIGAIDEQGRLIAGLVYHNYDPEAQLIEMSGAAITPRWLTRGMIARMHQYPFHQCGCQMVAMRIPADNERLLRQLAVYGYNFVLFPRLFGRERDGVIATLTSEDWAANRFNKRFNHHIDDRLIYAAEYTEEAA